MTGDERFEKGMRLMRCKTIVSSKTAQSVFSQLVSSHISHILYLPTERVG